MRSDPKKLLYDVATAVAAIRRFCEGQSQHDYESDLMLRSACERQFEVIGEAMTRLRDRHATVFARISDGPAIIAFRNRIIHGYDTVDPELVWDVIVTRLPHLQAAADALLQEGA